MSTHYTTHCIQIGMSFLILYIFFEITMLIFHLIKFLILNLFFFLHIPSFMADKWEVSFFSCDVYMVTLFCIVDFSMPMSTTYCIDMGKQQCILFSFVVEVKALHNIPTSSTVLTS